MRKIDEAGTDAGPEEAAPQRASDALRPDVSATSAPHLDHLGSPAEPKPFRLLGAKSGWSRREIRLAADFLPATLDEAEQALIEQEVALFQRGDQIVRSGDAIIKVSAGEQIAGERLYAVGPTEMREHMTCCARFVRYDRRAKAWHAVNCPDEVARAYLERRGRWQLRPLTGIITAPTLRSDGSLLAAPGYDEATALIYDPRGVKFPTIPEKPTREDARAALDTLKRLVFTFPFVTHADHSVALAAILTSVIRRSLPTAPMFAFSAPKAGSGKTKLADIAAIIATGQKAAVTALGESEAETEKRLGALLMSGDPAILIDNISRPLRGDFLCVMLTEEHCRPRILGKSISPRLPTSVLMLATGQNLIVSGDATRRALRCEIDPECEFPQQRFFSSDPVADAMRCRPRYLVAALTVLLGWIAAGRPPHSIPLGSFECWNMVRDALLWLGEADPCKTMAGIADADPERAELAATLDAIRETMIGEQTFSVAHLIGLAKHCGGNLGQPSDAKGEKLEHGSPLRDALLTVAADYRNTTEISARRLGRYFDKHKSEIVGGRRLVRAGEERSGVALWRIEHRGKAAPAE